MPNSEKETVKYYYVSGVGRSECSHKAASQLHSSSKPIRVNNTVPVIELINPCKRTVFKLRQPRLGKVPVPCAVFFGQILEEMQNRQFF